MIVDAEEFIGVKSFKAKGKRISNYTVEEVVEIEPREVPYDEDALSGQSDVEDTDEEIEVERPISQQDVLDELTGQKKLFDIEPDDGKGV